MRGKVPSLLLASPPNSFFPIVVYIRALADRLHAVLGQRWPAVGQVWEELLFVFKSSMLREKRQKRRLRLEDGNYQTQET